MHITPRKLVLGGFVLVLLLASLLGSGWFFSHQAETPSQSGVLREQRLPQTTPPSGIDMSPYDTRPCAARPSSQACNGKLPTIPWYIPVASSQAFEACLDEKLELRANVPLMPSKPGVGHLALMWSPQCQSYYAKVVVNRQETQVSIMLHQQDAGTAPQSVSRAAPASLIEVVHVYSPLLYSPDHPVVATAIITSPSLGGAPLLVQAKAETLPLPERRAETVPIPSSMRLSPQGDQL